MSNKVCDECCHRNVCKHESNMRNYIEEINKKPIPLDNDPITVIIKCGLFMPDVVTEKDGTAKPFVDDFQKALRQKPLAYIIHKQKQGGQLR